MPDDAQEQQQEPDPPAIEQDPPSEVVIEDFDGTLTRDRSKDGETR